MSENDRILVIVGAGASRELGVDGSKMPLMSDWSESLIADLDAADEGFANALGLRRGMSGPEFEAALGDFLAFVSTGLPLYHQFRWLGAGGLTGNIDQYVGDWGQRAEARTKKAVEIVRDNLYRSFGYARFDDGLAHQAFSALYERLQLPGRTTFLAFATTNYDSAIRAAFNPNWHGGPIGGRAWKILDGFRVEGLGTPVFNPTGMAHEWVQADSRLPILHLHGAVGWYEADGQVQLFNLDKPYLPNLGVPAVMLPDSAKTEATFAAGLELGQEFDGLLAESTHVLVIGHSLNDEYIFSKVADCGHPVGVGWHIPDSVPKQTASTFIRAQKDEIKAKLPHAIPISLSFGPEPIIEGSMFDAWRLSGQR